MDPTDTCRGCLKQEGIMYSLYEEYESNISLASLLTNFLKVQLNPDDGLPTTFCEDCAHTLIEFYNFTVVFEESEASLQAALKSLKDDNSDYEENNATVLRQEVFVTDEVEFEDVKGESTVIVKAESLTKSDDTMIIAEESMIIDDEVINGDSNENLCDSRTTRTVIIDVPVGNIKTETKYLPENFCNETPDSTTTSDFDYDKSNFINFNNAVHFQLQEENEQKVDLQQEHITKYECQECGDIYLYPLSFQKHMTIKHNKVSIDPKDFCTIISRAKVKVEVDAELFKAPSSARCRICKENFEDPQQLREHMSNHNIPKTYICEVCGKSFSKKSYLTDHGEIHNPVKRYECKYCKKKFQRRTVLAKHQKIHTNPKEIICEICGQSFTDKGTLTTHHKLRHQKIRDFQCLICNMNFPLKATLEKHILRHQRQNAEKTFACSICNMKYYDKSSLKRHTDMKHNQEECRVSCEQCGKMYTSKANLRKHTEKVH